jgi:hypothetical protein
MPKRREDREIWVFVRSSYVTSVKTRVGASVSKSRRVDVYCRVFLGQALSKPACQTMW